MSIFHAGTDVLIDEVIALRKALERIEAWQLPETNLFWDEEKTRPMTYSAAYGSNGEREYIRNIAREALDA